MSDSVDVSAILNSEEVPQVESSSEVVVEEVVKEVVEEVAPAPKEEVVEEVAPAPKEETSVEEVATNVREILTSEPSVLTDKERLVQLENRVEELVNILRSTYHEIEYEDNEFKWVCDMNAIHGRFSEL